MKENKGPWDPDQENAKGHCQWTQNDCILSKKAKKLIQRNVCSKHQKFFGRADGQHYTDSILKILAKQNYENSSQPGQSPMSISVHGMNVIHDFVCSFGKNLTCVAVELMQKNGHKTLQARDFTFALDLLMEPDKLCIFTKYEGFKALKKTRHIPWSQVQKTGNPHTVWIYWLKRTCTLKACCDALFFSFLIDYPNCVKMQKPVAYQYTL